MSWWLSSRDQKTGRRYVWLVGGGDLLMLMALLGLLVAFVAPAFLLPR
jgi:hypothetical protein